MAILLAPNASFIPTNPRDFLNPKLSAAHWGMEELNERLHTYGYGGIELHWGRLFRHCVDLQWAWPERARKLARAIVSGHESWRGVADPQPLDPDVTQYRTDLEPAGFKDKVVDFAGALALPTGSRSVRALRRVERKLHLPDWHYVMFPNPNGDHDADVAKTTEFPNSSIQPTPDVAACWGARSPKEFVEKLVARGYKATLDSLHISRNGKVVEARLDWKPLMALLLKAGLVEEVHIAPGREDFKKYDAKRYAESVTELKALENNTSLAGTPLGDFVDILNDHKWTGNVVLETTLPGLAAARGRRLKDGEFEKIHRNLTAGVKQLFPHIAWQSKFELAA